MNFLIVYFEIEICMKFNAVCSQKLRMNANEISDAIVCPIVIVGQNKLNAC